MIWVDTRRSLSRIETTLLPNVKPSLTCFHVSAGHIQRQDVVWKPSALCIALCRRLWIRIGSKLRLPTCSLTQQPVYGWTEVN